MKNIIITLSLSFFLFLIPNTINAAPCTDYYNSVQYSLNVAALNAAIDCGDSDLCVRAVEAAHTIASINNSQLWVLCCAASFGLGC